MSELESASSLFGSPGDSSTDPFSSNNDDSHTNASASTTKTDISSSIARSETTTSDEVPESSSFSQASTQVHTSDHLFGGPSADDDLFGNIINQNANAEGSDWLSGGTQEQENQSWSGVNGQGAEVNSYAAASSPSVGSSTGTNSRPNPYEPATSMQTQAPRTPSYGQQLTGYSQPQNGQSYAGHGGYGQPSAYNPTSNATVPTSTQPASVYNPYAPATQTTGTSHKPYDPYVPPAAATAPAQTANAYAAPHSYAPAQSSPYAPAAPVTPSYGTYGTSANSPYTATSQTIPAVPPPAPKAPLVRPKVSNAYDPPFPIASARKPSNPRSNPSMSSVYSAYGSPPPVPALPPSSMVSPYSSQYASPPPPSGPPLPRPSSTSSNSSNSYSPYGAAPTTVPHHRPPSTSSYSPTNQQQQHQVNPYAPSTNYGAPAPANVNAAGVPPTVARSTFSPPPRSASTASTKSQPPSQSPINRVTSPPQGPPRTASPAVHSIPSRKNSTHFTSTPPMNMGTSRVSSPSISQRMRSPSNSSTHSSVLQQLSRTASPAPETVPPPPDPYAPAASQPSGAAPVNGAPVNPYLPQRRSTEQFPNTPKAEATRPSVPPPRDNRYIPKTSSTLPPPLRSTSNASLSDSYTPNNPYAPPQHSRNQMSESDYGAFTSRYDYPNNEPVAPVAPSSGLGPPQELKAPTHTPYAPSPSLLGTNDPLGRTSARAPVFSFGFGGKIVACFHGADKMSTGFDVALASRNSTGISIRVLNKAIPESALDTSPSSFPGPLFSDPGTPTTGLAMRTGTSNQVKNKKTRLIKYLSDRAEEISMGLGYFHAGTAEKRQAEGKLVLVKLLRIMIENDGKLVATPQSEVAIRNALVPELELSGTSDADNFVSPGFSALGEDRAQTLGLASDPSDPLVVTSTLRASSLDKIQEFLLRGEKRKAYHYALDQKLWAHAMVIASGIDKESWKEVVNEFLRSELGAKEMAPATTSNPVFAHSQAQGSTKPASANSPNGREGLRVAYSLFSGQGASAVQELVPKDLMLQPSVQSQARLGVPMSHATPMTPNFAAPPPAANIPQQSLTKWSEMAAMMISNPITPETSSALTALGDQLSGNGWVEAGHACYLLSPQTSPVAGASTAGARVVLLGAPPPHLSTKYIRDTDAIIFSEILEFALGLTPPLKGHEPFHGLPHLQAFRLIRAACLAEIGEVGLASRYCDAIAASINRPSPYFTSTLSEQLRNLTDRIAGTAHSEKSNSWVGNKLGKPSLDSIGGWLEGRFTKLVTGDEDDGEGQNNVHKGDETVHAGPFSSKYSAISSTDPSPQSSVVNLNAYAPPSHVPARTGSSMSTRSLLNHHSVPVPQERAASALDYTPRRKVSPPPIPRIASASASTTTFAAAQARQANSIYSPPGTARQGDVGLSSSEINEEDEGQEVTWWGSSGGGYDNGKTPTTATFMQVTPGEGPAFTTSEDGFLSLADPYMPSPSPSASTFQRSNVVEEEEEEDLGFGNSKPKPMPPTSNDEQDDEKKKSVDAAPQRPDPKPVPAAAAATSSQSSGSWLSRLWKRESTPGPVKANLGEEKSFYYDKDLKRWVNKGAEPAAPTPAAQPPAPPSRAQTASPGMMAGGRPPSAGPPPPRSSSVADLASGGPPGGPPKGGPVRIRSNLVPSDAPPLPTSPLPNGSGLAPPSGPPSRPQSSASKRSNRSRYVDVFQDDAA